MKMVNNIEEKEERNLFHLDSHLGIGK